MAFGQQGQRRDDDEENEALLVGAADAALALVLFGYSSSSSFFVHQGKACWVGKAGVYVCRVGGREGRCFSWCADEGNVPLTFPKSYLGRQAARLPSPRPLTRLFGGASAEETRRKAERYVVWEGRGREKGRGLEDVMREGWRRGVDILVPAADTQHTSSSA